MVKDSKDNLDFLFWNILVIQLVISFFPGLLFIQALLITITGLYFAHKKLDKRFLCIVTLLAGCDIYYRQIIVFGLSSSVPWEFSKYCSALLCMVFYIFNYKYIKQQYSSLINFFYDPMHTLNHHCYFHGNMTYTSIKVTISGYFSGIISLYAIFKAFDGISINLNDLKNIVKYFFFWECYLLVFS